MVGMLRQVSPASRWCDTRGSTSALVRATAPPSRTPWAPRARPRGWCCSGNVPGDGGRAARTRGRPGWRQGLSRHHAFRSLRQSQSHQCTNQCVRLMRPGQHAKFAVRKCACNEGVFAFGPPTRAHRFHGRYPFVRRAECRYDALVAGTCQVTLRTVHTRTSGVRSARRQSGRPYLDRYNAAGVGKGTAANEKGRGEKR